MMFDEPSELDKAEMRQEYRRLYREIGHMACLQVLYEILKAGEIFAEVMVEERNARPTDMDHG